KNRLYVREKNKANLAAEKKFLDTIAEFEKLRLLLIDQARTECLDLAICIAKEIITCELQTNATAFAARINDCLSNLNFTNEISLSINPKEIHLAEKINRSDLKIKTDESLLAGEIVVDTGNGLIKFSLEEHLKQIGDSLQQEIKSASFKN
ncbi:MAG: hypothetical protein KDD56_07825, partial [Bdellovibrionales bacterium]|nr:hypothetical protein [Bdellovibrionales bacterium]